jgi:hypothetical protein
VDHAPLGCASIGSLTAARSRFRPEIKERVPQENGEVDFDSIKP